MYLDTLTRTDAASDFFGRASVPRQAISMGVSTILGAKRVILLAFGEGKAAAVRATVEDAPGSHYPASFLQSHPSATVILDRGAAQELTRVAAPWTLAGAQDMVWRNVRAVCEAVCWLSRQRNRPILQLRAEDYAMCAALQALFAEHSFAAAKVNQMVFDVLTAKLTRDPTFALPPAVESHVPSTFTSRPEGSARGGAKRVLLLSPHPDDDVISMGGTLALLTQQGHEVWVGYQTSGAIAVKDEDLLDRLAFTAGLEAAARLQGSKGGGSPSEPRVNEYLPEGNETGTVKEASDAKIQGIVADLVQQVEGKGPLDPDPLLVQRAKALVRQCEARSAAAACGVPSARLRFLDSPFYQTGTVVKAPLTQADIQLVADLVSESSPDVVFLAGDLSDPHGTHRTCLEAALRALSQSRQDPNRPLHPDVLLYRGAWQEWAPHDADLLVPLTPEELQRKLGAIKRHQSQKDPPLYPGVDGREFWERAEDRNRGTAEALRALGLPSFEGVEAFVRCTAVEGGGWEILGGSVKLRG